MPHVSPGVWRAWMIRHLQSPLSTAVPAIGALLGLAFALLYGIDLSVFHPFLSALLVGWILLSGVLLYLSSRTRPVSIVLYCLGCTLFVSLIIVTFAFMYSNVIIAYNHYADGFRFPDDFDRRRWSLPDAERPYMVRNYALYFSAATYFTVGYGDIHPLLDVLRLLAALEAMTGYLVTIFIVTVGISNIRRES